MTFLQPLSRYGDTNLLPDYVCGFNLSGRLLAVSGEHSVQPFKRRQVHLAGSQPVVWAERVAASATPPG